MNKQTVEELKKLLDASSAPWEYELDMFEDYYIEASIYDGPPNWKMLARIETGIRSHTPSPDDEKWTAEDEEKKLAAWKLAYESQALKDAKLISHAINTLSKLLESYEAAMKVVRIVSESDPMVSAGMAGMVPDRCRFCGNTRHNSDCEYLLANTLLNVYESESDVK